MSFSFSLSGSFESNKAVVMSQGNSITARFSTDSSRTATGFTATYEISKNFRCSFMKARVYSLTSLQLPELQPTVD